MKSLTPKTPSPKSAQQALGVNKPILVKVPAPSTLPPPPPTKLPPPPPESEGLVALYKDPVEEVADPFFQLDVEASPVNHVSGSSSDTLDIYPN